MPTPEQLAAVLGFQPVFETALKAGLDANEITCSTSQLVPSTGGAASDAELVALGFIILQFKKPRPRAEVTFRPGGGLGRFIPFAVNGKRIKMETCWTGQYNVRCLTKADIREHNAFVIALRFLMLTMGQRINGPATLPKHHIAPEFKDAGTSQTTSPETGVLQTDLQFDIQFSVQADAWAALES